MRNDSTTTTTTTAKSVISTASGSAPSPRVSSPSAFKYYTHFLSSIPHFSELKPVVSSSSTAHHHHHHNHHHRSSSRNRDRGTTSNQATSASASTPVYSNGNTSLQNKQFNKSNDSNLSSSSSFRKQQPIQSYKPNPLYGRLNSSNASKESLDLKKTPGNFNTSTC